MHDEMVEQVNKRHTDYKPVEGVRQHHPHFAAIHQPGDNRHLCGHDNDGVWVIPEEVGIAGYDCRCRNSSAKTEE
ncbi:MAG: hypothetical protein WCP33_01705, partial [Deltaproteobacteria bacterium]